MFKVDVARLAEASLGVLQETQDIRVAYERTDAALGAVLPTAAGAWYKTGSLATSRFKRDLGELRDGLTSLSNTMSSASAMATGTLLPQYGAVLSTLGAGSSGSVICLDESVAVDAAYQFVSDSTESMLRQVAAAQDSLGGLEDSGGIATHLDDLHNCVQSTQEQLDQAQRSFNLYETSVQRFESEYAGKLDSSSFMTKTLIVAINDGIKDTKGAFGILKHVFSLGATVGKIAGNTWEPSSTKPFVEGFSSKVGDWARPQKWRAATDTLSRAASSAGDAVDDAVDALADAAQATSRAAQWGERLDAAGKLAGYVGDGLAVFGIAAGTVKSYEETSGDEADKAAAATYTLVSDATKFITGKAVGALIGTALGGPAGTAVGFLAGCAFDFAWDKATEWMERSGVRDEIVHTVGDAYRETGRLLTEGFNWVTSFGGG